MSSRSPTRLDRSAQNSTVRSFKGTSEMEENRELLHARRVYDKKDLIKTNFNASLQGSKDSETNRMNEKRVSNINCILRLTTFFNQFKEILDSVVAENIQRKRIHDSVTKTHDNWNSDDISDLKGDENAKATYFLGVARSMTAFQFNRFRISFNQSFTQKRLQTQPALLYDKLMFLNESMKIINQQLIRERDSNQHLKQRVQELILEKSIANSKKAYVEHDLTALNQRFQDTKTTINAAWNKYVRTNSNLLAMKNEIKALKSREKEFFSQKDLQLHSNRQIAENFEDSFSKTLLQLDDAKTYIEKLENQYYKAVRNEEQLVKNIMDSEKTVQYIQIIDRLNSEFLLKDRTPRDISKNTSRAPSRGRKTNRSVEKVGEFRKSIEETFLTISNMNTNAKTKQMRSKSQLGSSMTNFDEAQKSKTFYRDSKRGKERSGTSRELVISKINAFADKYQDGGIEKLMDDLITEYRKRLMNDQGLQKQYASGIYEKNRKQLLLEELREELELLKDQFEIEQQIQRIEDIRKKNKSIILHSERSELPERSKSQVLITAVTQFEAQNTESDANDENLQTEISQFLFRSYEYLLDSLTRMCNTILTSNEISRKAPSNLNQKIEELGKFLSEAGKVIPRLTKQNKEDISSSPTMQKKLAKLFKDKVETLRSRDGGATDALEEDILKELKEDEETKEEEKPFGQQLKKLKEFESRFPVTKNHLQAMFQEYFADTTGLQAKEFAALIIEDILFKQFATEPMVKSFLEEQSQTNKEVQNQGQAVIDNIWIFKDQVMDIQRSRFGFLLSNLLEILIATLKEKNENHSFIKQQKKLTLASWIRDLSIQKADDEYAPEFIKQSVQNKIENLIKYQDYEAFEEKEKIRKEALMKREDEMTALLKVKQKEIGDIALIRERITELARDNRRKVWQTYTEFSRSKRPQTQAQKLISSIKEQKNNPVLSKIAPIKDVNIIMLQMANSREGSRQGMPTKHQAIVSNTLNDEVVELDYMESLRENVKHGEERKIMEIISNNIKEREKNSVVQRLMPKQKSMVKKMNEDTKMLNRFGRLKKITSSSEFEKKVIDAVNIPNYITDAEIPGKYRLKALNRSASVGFGLKKINEENQSIDNVAAETRDSEIFKQTLVDVVGRDRKQPPVLARSRNNEWESRRLNSHSNAGNVEFDEDSQEETFT